MAEPKSQKPVGLATRIGVGLLIVLGLGLLVGSGPLQRTLLNPRVPFQTYDPPPAPDYAKASSWALLDARLPASGPAAVFFVHSTTFNGGKDWNGAVDDEKAIDELRRVVLPNYAAPFARGGPVSAPLYRQSSLYSRLTARDDALEARAFAFGDVQRAWQAFLADHPTGPIVVVGVEQGADLAARLLNETIAPSQAVTGRLAAAYLIDTVTPAVLYAPGSAIPACAARDQSGCVVGWTEVRETDAEKAQHWLHNKLVWASKGRFTELGPRQALCVNPVLGTNAAALAPARLHRGAANATGLEWGVRPAFIQREVSAQCVDGLLQYSRPASSAFLRSTNWAARRKAPGFNIFYADLETDVQGRVAAWINRNPTVPPASRTAPPTP